MTVVGPRFVLPYQTVVDNAGVPIPGAFLFFYISGTSTPLNTYSNASLTVPNTNPVQANGAGVFGNIFMLPQAYKVVLTDSLGNMIWTADPVSGSGSTGSARNQRSITTGADLPILTSDSILNINAATDLVPFVPLGGPRVGAPLTFKNLPASAAQTLTATSPNTFDGETSLVLQPGASLTLVPYNDSVNAGYAIE